MHRTPLTPPTVKDFLIQNVNGLEIEKPYLHCCLLEKKKRPRDTWKEGGDMIWALTSVLFKTLSMRLMSSMMESMSLHRISSYIPESTRTPEGDICNPQMPNETSLTKDLFTKLLAALTEMSKGQRSVLKTATVI